MLVPAGEWRTFEYDTPDLSPVFFGGESRAEGVQAREYSVYADIWHDDGSTTWGRRAYFSEGTHDWEDAACVYVPAKPIKTIKVHALHRNGTGKAEFRNLFLRRGEGTGEVFNVRRMTNRPFADTATVFFDEFRGKEVAHRTRREPLAGPRTPVLCGQEEFRVWTASSTELVTPETFPPAAAGGRPELCLDLPARGDASGQILVTCGARAWTNASVRLGKLISRTGDEFHGNVKWERVGYLAREPGAFAHPAAPPATVRWLPDPLLPAAPFAVRAQSTQGVWLTAHADDAAPSGVYSGEAEVLENGIVRSTVALTVRVYPFALPRTFGMETAFCVMDGFLKAYYGDRLAAIRRQAWDVMLDHRLNPDDISRTEPPPVEELLHARARGMNRFNVVNLVPKPKDPKQAWIGAVKDPGVISDPAFYADLKARLDPYVAELRRHGLEREAYFYGFDERREPFYPAIDAIWKKLKADYPDIPLMTTAKIYRTLCEKGTNHEELVTTDWYCPTTDAWNDDITAFLKSRGKRVWWYVCCWPVHPYANFASYEYPPIEGRILAWQTYLKDADGFLYWHVNYWHQPQNPQLDESDTYFPDWHTACKLRMPGDGILLYPGRRGILPSVRLAQVRDGIEDYEIMKLAEARVGREAVLSAVRELTPSLTDYSRDGDRLRRLRRRILTLLLKGQD